MLNKDLQKRPKLERRNWKLGVILCSKLLAMITLLQPQIK